MITTLRVRRGGVRRGISKEGLRAEGKTNGLL